MSAPTPRELRKKMERRDKAIATQKQFAADRERVLGPDHPDTLTARVRLQELLHVEGLTSLGIGREAEEKLTADCTRVLGLSHPDTVSISALSLSYSWSQGPGKGLSLEAEESLAAYCARRLGRDHPASRTIRRSLDDRRAKSASYPAPLHFWDAS